MIRRLNHVVLELLAAMLLVVLVVVALGVWRLSRGPLSVSWVTPYLEAAVNQGGDMVLHIGATRLAWVKEPILPALDGPPGGVLSPTQRHHGSLEVVGEHVTVVAPDGTLVANLPEIRTTFSVPALLQGRLVPTRISLVGPHLNAVRDADGTVHLALALDDSPDDGNNPFVDELMAALRQRPDPSRPLGALSKVAVRDARLTIDDRKLGRQWVADHADIFLARDVQGIRGRADLSLNLGDGRASQLAGDIRYTTADGTLALITRFQGVSPADFARFLPPPPVAAPVPLPPVAPPAPPSSGRKRGGAGKAAPTAVPGPAVSPGAASPGAPPPGPAPAPAAMDTGAILAGIAVPLDGTIAVTLDHAFQPQAADLQIGSAGGTITLPNWLKTPLPVKALDVRAHMEPGRLDLQRLFIDLGGPSLSLQVAAQRPPATPAAPFDLTLSGELKALPLTGLDRYWPQGVLANARAWMVQNLADGHFDSTTFQVAGTVPADFSDMAVKRTQADFAFSGITVTYMDGLPPVRGVGGHAVYSGGRITMALDRGQVFDLKLGASKLVFSGLEADQQYLDIDVPLSGPVASALAVIDRPPLGYASKVGIKPEAVGGKGDITLRFSFPLVAALRMDQVKLGVQAALSGVSIDHVVSDINATEGRLDLSVDNHGMDVAGTARLNGMPSHLKWRENFDDSAAFSTRLAVQALANDSDRRRFRLDFPDWVRGVVGVDMTYTKDAQRQERIAATLDLSGAGLAVPLMDWRKVPGTAASASFDLLFDHGQPLHFPRVQINTRGAGGVPDLSATGSVDLRPGDYGLRHLVVDRYQQGRTDAHLVLDVADDGAMRVEAHGASLDARGLRRQASANRATTPAARQAQAALDDKRPPLDVSFDFNRVITGEEDRQIQAAKGRLERRGRSWRRVEVDALAGTAPVPAPPPSSRKAPAPPPAPPQPGRLVLRYLPDGAAMSLSLEAEDAGATLHDLGVLEHVRGGVLTVHGKSAPGDLDEVVHGNMVLENFQVVDAPVLARLLSAASFQGLSDFVSGAPIAFTTLNGNFRWTNDGVDFRDVHTTGSAIGLTLQGQVNVQANTADLQGTIVPFSTLNKLLDSIPVIGNLLSGGEGQGLLSATYHISGSLDDLDVSVNPLAVLAPGFLRNLFFLSPTPGDDKPGAAKGPDGKPPR